MQPLQPDQARLLLDAVYLPALANEHRITAGVVGAIPLDKGDFRPDEISRGALDAAWHIVSTEMRFMEAVAAGEFDLTPRPRPESIENSADLNHWYTEKFQKALAGLEPLSGEQLAKVINFRNMFQLPAVMYLGFVLHHTVHHRGQLSTYLRPMGAKVPAIYGESFDTAAARKAAEQSAS